MPLNSFVSRHSAVLLGPYVGTGGRQGITGSGQGLQVAGRLVANTVPVAPPALILPSIHAHGYRLSVLSPIVQLPQPHAAPSHRLFGLPAKGLSSHLASALIALALIALASLQPPGPKLYSPRQSLEPSRVAARCNAPPRRTALRRLRRFPRRPQPSPTTLTSHLGF